MKTYPGNKAARLLAACSLATGLAALANAAQAQVKIGFITDMSSLYADIEGKNAVIAMQMAIDDFGGKVLGQNIELLSADHQSKADIAASRAREWIDTQGLSMVFSGTNSGTALAVSQVANEKKRVHFNSGAGSSALTNEQCNPYTVHYAYDTVALAKGTGSAVVDEGGKSWFFLTADYAFGHALEADTSAVVKARGGSVVGSVRHPINGSDFSSFLLQAQSSKAQILGLANAGGDTINSLKAAREFGIHKNMRPVGLLVFITDIHSLGLRVTEGLQFTTSWYWDMNDATRGFAQRFYEKTKVMPSSIHAADYSAVTSYLKAVQAVGSTDADQVMAQLKSTAIDDFYGKGVIRPDGTFAHDMYLVEVKKQAESKRPWDYLKIVSTLDADSVWTTRQESKCALWKP